MTQNWNDLLQTDDPGFAWEALQDALKAEAESDSYAQAKADTDAICEIYNRISPLIEASMSASVKAVDPKKQIMRDLPIALIFAAAIQMSCVKEVEGGRFDVAEAKRVLPQALDMAILLTEAITQHRNGDHKGK